METITNKSEVRQERALVEAGVTVKFGLDVHAGQITVCRQLGGMVAQPAQRMSWQGCLEWIEAHVKAGAVVHACYEAGPCGYGLHRRLLALGVKSYVVVPQRWDAQNKRVKAFAEMMIRDHTKANGELESLLKGKNYSPKKMDKEDNHMSALKNQKGRDFDRAYMKMMVKDHDKDIDLFTKESNSGKDNQLKDFARKTLPVLKTHLDSAKAIYSDLNKSTMY
jgi:hypothetical protein